MSEKKRYALNIFLLSLPADVKVDGTTGWHSAALKEPGAKQSSLQVPGLPGAVLYTKQYPSGPPKWSKYFPQSVQQKLRNSSTGGVILLNVDKQLIAVSFGLGRHILASQCIVESFGLKTTVNLIEANRVRSLDKVTFDQITRHSRVQATQQGDAAAFQVNVNQDIVRAITGVPEDKSFGSRLSGRDSLTMTVEMADLSGLPTVLRRVLKAYRDTKYKERFAWIDHVSEVKNEALIGVLERLLEERIAAKNYQRLWMSAPEIIDWERVAGFKYSDSDLEPLVDDLDIKVFLANFSRRGTKKEIKVGSLRSRRVYAYDPEGQRLFSPWSAYQCIYFETEHDGETYLLNLGRWYRIEKSYVEQVNQYIAEIDKCTLVLPGWKPKETEPKYNKRAWKLIDDAVFMDAENLSFGGGRSKVEFCDIMTKNPRRLIFVKRYRGSSALSHLFSQAVVTARTLKIDAAFRKLVNDNLPTSHRFAVSEVTSSEWEIVFAIMSRSLNDLVLPFFSRVTLMVAHEQLRAMGFKVSLQKVAQVSGKGG